MLPFRELEVFDAFMLDGQECDKVGTDKYLTYDEMGEPKSLEVSDPNMMVELAEEEETEAVERENDFFRYLLGLLDGLEKHGGEKLTIKSLKQFAEDRLAMTEDD